MFSATKAIDCSAHHSVKTFCIKHPAFTEPSVRWIIFKRGPELEKQGAIYHNGRRVVIIEQPFLDALRAPGKAA